VFLPDRQLRISLTRDCAFVEAGFRSPGLSLNIAAAFMRRSTAVAEFTAGRYG